MVFEFGNKIKCTIFGSAHADEIGVEIKGLPKNFTPDIKKTYDFMKRRSPSAAIFSTQRKENDLPYVTINENSIEARIPNSDIKPTDYNKIRYIPRPGHADYTSFIKYGKIETGGGVFSGRMTAPVCFAGGICKQYLEEKKIRIYGRIKKIYNIQDDAEPSEENLKNIAEKKIPVITDSLIEKILAIIQTAKDNGDSIGAIVECNVFGLPAGLGGAMTDGIESLLSRDIFGIPAVKGIEFGSGFSSCEYKGSENNDPFYYDKDTVKTKTNNSGGILGGISTGMPLVFRCAIKPTPSISIEQDSVNLLSHENTKIRIEGRHDICCGIRAVPIIEAVTAITIAGLLSEDSLSTLRANIDIIDNKITEFLLKRKALTDRIGKIKKDNNIPVQDQKRENEIISRVTKGHNESEKEYINKIMNAIFTESRKSEGEK